MAGHHCRCPVSCKKGDERALVLSLELSVLRRGVRAHELEDIHDDITVWPVRAAA
jgi:hypothetical protein